MIETKLRAGIQELVCNLAFMLGFSHDKLTEKQRENLKAVIDKWDQDKPHECNCEFCGSPETHVLGETAEERAGRICRHEGLKRYCGKDVYCETCKREMSAELCDKPQHSGPCSTDSEKFAGINEKISGLLDDSEKAVEAKIDEIARMEMTPEPSIEFMKDVLRGLVRLVRSCR